MLRLNEQIQDDITIVSLKGFIDTFSCHKLEESVNQLLEKKNYKIIVDLTHVDYMSSVGAGIFIALHCAATENKGVVVMVNPRSQVREIFGLLGMSRIFSFTDTVDNAFKLINEGTANSGQFNDRPGIAPAGETRNYMEKTP